MNKALMLLVKQAAAFNASRAIFQSSGNGSLYDIDTPLIFHNSESDSPTSSTAERETDYCS